MVHQKRIEKLAEAQLEEYALRHSQFTQMRGVKLLFAGFIFFTLAGFV
jgi:hypothetical protein